MELASKECRQRSNSTHEWHLAKIDTMGNLVKMDKKIREALEKGNLAEAVFWLGLVRNETADASNWADSSKWYWIMDNTTLDKSTIKPLWEDDQPDNVHFKSKGVKESCVIAKWELDDCFHWHDYPCELPKPVDGFMKNGTKLLVCETKAPDRAQKPSPPPDGPKLPWILLGIVLVLCLLLLLLIGIISYRQRRRRKTGVGSGTTLGRLAAPPSASTKSGGCGKESKPKAGVSMKTGSKATPGAKPVSKAESVKSPSPRKPKLVGKK